MHYEVVSYESLNGKEFKTEAHVKRYMHVQAQFILTNNKLIPTSACLKQEVHSPGLVQLPKKFKIIRRHKRRQYLNDSREEVVDDILNDVEC